MATRCVLKYKFGYKNIYGGFPFAGNIFYVINNEKEEKKSIPHKLRKKGFMNCF